MGMWSFTSLGTLINPTSSPMLRWCVVSLLKTIQLSFKNITLTLSTISKEAGLVVLGLIAKNVKSIMLQFLATEFFGFD